MKQETRQKININGLDRSPIYSDIFRHVVDALSSMIENKAVLSSDEEDDINSKIDYFLPKEHPLFKFGYQNTSGGQGRSTPDFSVLPKYGDRPWENPFVVIEAKLLHRNSSYNKDYVQGQGNGGGIERFKRCRHGVTKSGKPLTQSIMFGYVKDNQTYGFEHWHTKTNNLISKLAEHDTLNFWEQSDRLGKLSPIASTSDLVQCKSNHKRKNSNFPNVGNITLTHIWILFR